MSGSHTSVDMYQQGNVRQRAPPLSLEPPLSGSRRYLMHTPPLAATTQWSRRSPLPIFSASPRMSTPPGTTDTIHGTPRAMHLSSIPVVLWEAFRGRILTSTSEDQTDTARRSLARTVASSTVHLLLSRCSSRVAQEGQRP